MPDFRDPFGGRDPRVAQPKKKDVGKKDAGKKDKGHGRPLEENGIVKAIEHMGELAGAMATAHAAVSGARLAGNRLMGLFPRNGDPFAGLGGRNADGGAEPEPVLTPRDANQGEQEQGQEQGQEQEPDQEQEPNDGAEEAEGAEGAEEGVAEGVGEGAEGVAEGAEVWADALEELGERLLEVL